MGGYLPFIGLKWPQRTPGTNSYHINRETEAQRVYKWQDRVWNLQTPRLSLFSKHCGCPPWYSAIKKKTSHSGFWTSLLLGRRWRTCWLGDPPQWSCKATPPSRAVGWFGDKSPNTWFRLHLCSIYCHQAILADVRTGQGWGPLRKARGPSCCLKEPCVTTWDREWNNGGIKRQRSMAWRTDEWKTTGRIRTKCREKERKDEGTVQRLWWCLSEN